MPLLPLSPDQQVWLSKKVTMPKPFIVLTVRGKRGWIVLPGRHSTIEDATALAQKEINEGALHAVVMNIEPRPANQ